MPILFVLLLLVSCGSSDPGPVNLTCSNNGNGTQTCVTGGGEVVTAPCSSANGAGASVFDTSTGQPVELPPCDLSTTTNNPPA